MGKTVTRKSNRPICVMCKQRPGKVINGERRDRDGKLWEYENSTKVPLFCSVRCAANWALLWFDFVGNQDELEECNQTALE